LGGLGRLRFSSIGSGGGPGCGFGWGLGSDLFCMPKPPFADVNFIAIKRILSQAKLMKRNTPRPECGSGCGHRINCPW